MKTGDNRNLRKGRRKLRVIRFYTSRRRVLHPGRVFFALACVWSFWSQTAMRKATAWCIAFAAVYCVYLLRCYTIGKERVE